MKRNIVETRHGEISFLDGEGQIPVVLLHGLGGMGNVFFKLSGCIPKKYRLIFPDLLGHGHSKSKSADITIQMQRESIEDFIENLNLKNPVVGGHSYGGWVSLSYATTHEDISGLILIGSAGTNPTLATAGESEIEKFLNQVVAVNKSNDRDTMRNIIMNNNKEDIKIGDDLLRKIKIPTLILWGSDDPRIPVDYGVKLSKEIKNSKMQIIQGGGHNIHYSHYEEVCKSINQFLEPLFP
jgi:pimeloyl-ACP methyl ester carboxylesterase